MEELDAIDLPIGRTPRRSFSIFNKKPTKNRMFKYSPRDIRLYFAAPIV